MTINQANRLLEITTQVMEPGCNIYAANSQLPSVLLMISKLKVSKRVSGVMFHFLGELWQKFKRQMSISQLDLEIFDHIVTQE